MFEFNGYHRVSERDYWDGGCDANSATDTFIDINVQVESIEALVKKIGTMTGARPEHITLDACDELGRIDAQVTENRHGRKANATELGMWKEGKIPYLFATTYSFYVKEVRTIELSSLVAA